MVSIIITTKDPEETFKKSFNSILESVEFFRNNNNESEIIIVTPERYDFLNSLKGVTILEDKKEGKPAAISLGVKKAKGEWLVFTDGDILLEKESINELYSYALKEKLSICGGKPVTMEDKNTMMGYWSHALVEGNAAKIREEIEEKRLEGKHAFFPVSGYLFIVKAALMPKVENEELVDDAYISYYIYKQGYQIGYDNKAIVHVAYPKTYKDYIIQKKRSAGGYRKGLIKRSGVRSFGYESIHGFLNTINYAKSPKELFWSILLLLSRLHLWVVIFYTFKIKKQDKIWDVVSTSKQF